MHRITGYLVIAFICQFTQVNAQFTKGTRMVGASVASIIFNSGSSDQEVASIGGTTASITGYNVNLTPSMGWFLSENTAIGVSLILNPSGEKLSFQENGSVFQRDNTRNFNIGLGAFARSYFKSSGDLLPFGQANVGGGIRNSNKDGIFYGGSGSNAYKLTYDTRSPGGAFMDFGLNLGVTKMVGESVGIDLFLGYQFSYDKSTLKTTRLRDIMNDGTVDETEENETQVRYSNHRFSLGLAFQVFLKKKK